MHESTFAGIPHEGQTVYCRKCRDYSVIFYVRIWTAKCADCSYRNHEGDVDTCGIKARRHSDAKGHRVEIHYPGTAEVVSLVPHRMLDLPVAS